MLSLNQLAYKLVQELAATPAEFGTIISKSSSGATIIDAGLRVKGGFNAGKTVTEICMGGLGEARIFREKLGDIELPSIFVYTDHPALATLGAQFAGWQIQKGDFFAIGSGPARALALKPSDIYREIDYKDESDVAVVVLETGQEPPESVIKHLSSECGVSPSNLYIVLVPTTSIAGSTQVSGRIVETGLHKLSKLGIKPLSIQCAWGSAPIAPTHPKFVEAMGKTNDVILYGGTAYYTLEHEDDIKLKATLSMAPSSASKHYGKPFKEIFEEANRDFYKIDPNLFAPARIIVNNVVTGSVFQVGEINHKVLKKALGLTAY